MRVGGTPPAWPRRAALVGSGTMGAGFAQLFAAVGVEARVVDVSPTAAEAARERVVALTRSFEEAGLVAAGAADAVDAHVTAAGSLAEGVADADLVLEAVTEDPQVKLAVFAEVEAAAPQDAVVASNTSAIPIASLAAGIERPERFLGMHWFNPPQWVPCVEVIPTPATRPDVVERVHAFLRHLGKRPVSVGDRAGFVANRIQFAMFKEAVSVVADGVATPEQVDEVVRSSFGFRLPFYGPFTIAEMAGLDVYTGAYAALTGEFGPRFEAPELLARLVAEGRLGVKSGGGFLALSDAEAAELVARRDRSYAALRELLEELDA